MNQRRPPNDLTPAARKIWGVLLHEFDFTDSELIILCTALRQYDRAAEAQELIRREGLVIDGRRHAACDIEKVAVGLFLRAWRSLNMNCDPPMSLDRLPGR